MSSVVTLFIVFFTECIQSTSVHDLEDKGGYQSTY